MTRRLMIFVTSAVLMFGAAQLLAHEEFQISGTVISRQGLRLEVKTSVDGRKVSIGLTEGTTIWRDKKKVAVTELKPGRTVLVDAYGDSEADCIAFEVLIVTASTSTKK